MPLESHAPSPDEIKKRPAWANARTVFTKWELLEFSPVTVPANPEALALAVKSKAFALSDKLIEQLGLKQESGQPETEGSEDGVPRENADEGQAVEEQPSQRPEEEIEPEDEPTDYPEPVTIEETEIEETIIAETPIEEVVIEEQEVETGNSEVEQLKLQFKRTLARRFGKVYVD